MHPAPSVKVAMYWPEPRLEIVVLFPPGSENPAGPVHVSTPGGGDTVIKTVISPSLSPAQDSCFIESMTSVDADKSLTLNVTESVQFKSSVTLI